jgi:hypothetical protein
MKLFLTLFASVMIAGSPRAAIFTNSASADSFVRSYAPTLNYGGAGSLSVSGPTSTKGSGVANGASDTFIRFNTAAMVMNFNFLFGTNNWSIISAKLRVTEMGAPPNGLFNRGTGAFEIRWIANDNWTEGTGTPMAPTTTGITYNDEPTLLNGGTDTSLGTFTNMGVGGTENFPLALPATFTTDLKAGGEARLYLTAIDPSAGFTFNSRSFMTVSARPFLEISAGPRPGISAINLSGTNMVLAATNDVAGRTYYVMNSTNAALPLNQWTPVATNVLTANGNFTITVTNAANANTPSPQFFILQTQ